jgi:hypothetical protein
VNHAPPKFRLSVGKKNADNSTTYTSIAGLWDSPNKSGKFSGKVKPQVKNGEKYDELPSVTLNAGDFVYLQVVE